MAVNSWVDLTCECCSQIFVEARKVQYLAGTGTSIKPAGLMCVACHLYADMDYLISRVKVERTKAAITEAEEEMREAQQQVKRGPQQKEERPDALTSRHTIPI